MKKSETFERSRAIVKSKLNPSSSKGAAMELDQDEDEKTKPALLNLPEEVVLTIVKKTRNWSSGLGNNDFFEKQREFMCQFKETVDGKSRPLHFLSHSLKRLLLPFRANSDPVLSGRRAVWLLPISSTSCSICFI